MMRDSHRKSYLYGRAVCRAIRISLMPGLVGATIIGCSTRPAPMVIHMYNPKTHQALVCSARDQTARSDNALLANAVESCAKTLESRGFIREK